MPFGYRLLPVFDEKILWMAFGIGWL